jgi:hypothetical protein
MAMAESTWQRKPKILQARKQSRKRRRLGSHNLLAGHSSMYFFLS